MGKTDVGNSAGGYYLLQCADPGTWDAIRPLNKETKSASLCEVLFFFPSKSLKKHIIPSLAILVAYRCQGTRSLISIKGLMVHFKYYGGTTKRASLRETLFVG